MRDTLASVRNQASAELEIVVVCFDGGSEAARAAAQDDTRARFLDADSVSAARAVGVEHSKGDHVLVASPGDRYPDAAIADLVPTLADGETLWLNDGLDNGTVVPGDLAGDLELRPDLARLPYLGRLVVPRERLLGAATDDDLDGMQTALAVLRYGCTMTPFRAYADARDAATGPPVPDSDPFDELPAAIERDRVTQLALADLPPAAEQRALGGLLGIEVFLTHAAVAGDEQWQQLGDHCRTLRDRAPGQLDSLPVTLRALALLAAEDRRDEVESLVARARGRTGFPTRVRAGRVLADLGADLPDDVLEVGEDESTLVAAARRFVIDDGSTRLEVLAGVRHLDTGPNRAVAARLVGGDRALPLVVRLGSDPAVTHWMGGSGHDQDGGLLTLIVPVEDLTPGAWEIELDWSDREVRRVARVRHLIAQGSAARPPVEVRPGLLAQLQIRHGRVALLATLQPGTATAGHPDEITGLDEPAPPTLSRFAVEDDLVRLTVDRSVDRVRLRGGGLEVEAAPGSAGFWTLPLATSLDGAEHPLPAGPYELLFSADGGDVPVRPSANLVDLLPLEQGAGERRVQLLLHRSTDVRVRLR
ncbi:MAG TPA: glycosyltransferase [Marmoricola sp.]|nr:glycosyltransferase [Marmoricola sp.]